MNFNVGKLHKNYSNLSNTSNKLLMCKSQKKYKIFGFKKK